MNSEKDNLICRDKAVEETGSMLWKYIILCIALTVTLIGGITAIYVQTEWVQHKVQTDMFPDMIVSKLNASTCGDTNKTDPAYRNHTLVQQQAAHWLLYLNLANHIPMFIMNLILNTYTDTYGRKFLFILSLSGVCFRYFVLCAQVYFNQSLWYLLGAYFVDGALGSLYGLFAGSYAYIADIANNNRNRVLGIVGMDALVMTTAVIGSAMSGYLVETLNLGFAKTIFICTSLVLTGFLMFIFLVPESLPKSKRTPPKPLVGTVRKVLQFYVSSEFKGKRLGYILLISSFSIAEMGFGNRSGLETLYFLALPFCWDPSRIGIFLSVRHAAQGIVGTALVKVLQVCLSNEAIAIIGTISNAGSYIVEGLATTDLMIYMVPVVGMLSSIMIPLIRGIMSVITDSDKQGALFSSLASIQVLSQTISTIASNEIYAATYSFMHGFVFLYLAGLCVVSTILLMAYYVYKKVNLKSVNNYEDLSNVN